MDAAVSAPLRAIVVDDEPLARRGLEIRLAAHADVQIVGYYGDGASAIGGLREHRPDLMFLDVQMPGLDGFGTLRAIPAPQMPLVVFVTAYDHYAIRAFESSAVDYLLKPVEDSRLHQALYRVREQLGKREAQAHCEQLLRRHHHSSQTFCSGDAGIGIGQAIYQVPAMWRSATGEDLFRQEPALRGFLQRIEQRPGYQRAVARGGSLEALSGR